MITTLLLLLLLLYINNIQVVFSDYLKTSCKLSKLCSKLWEESQYCRSLIYYRWEKLRKITKLQSEM